MLPFPAAASALWQILEAAVVGVPDDTLGEKVVAVIALRTSAAPPANSPSLLQRVAASSAAPDTANASDSAPASTIVGAGEIRDALKGFLADKLAVYKQPRAYVVVDAIPRNHLGKVSTCLLSYFLFGLHLL